MKQHSKLYYLLFLLVATGLVLSARGQEPTKTKGTALNTVTASEPDSVEILKDAIVAYLNAAADYNNYFISAGTLKETLRKNNGADLVIDIRKQEDYLNGHIPDAINLHLKEIGAKLDKIRAAADGRTVVVVCLNGQGAGQIISLLNIDGIKALELKDGMGTGKDSKGWLGAKFPMSTEPTPMTDMPPVAIPNKAIDQAVRNYFLKLPPPPPHIIDGKDLYDKLAASPDAYVILDIRKPQDFENGHIKGAMNYQFGPAIAQNIDVISENAKGKTLIVYSYSGQASGQVISMLNTIGIKVESLKGGFDAGWHKLFPKNMEK